jgi:hypothetical protein
MIMQNSFAMDFVAPEPLVSNNSDGDISVEIISRYEYLSRKPYIYKAANMFSGAISAAGTADVLLGNPVLTVSPPIFETIFLQNYGRTNTSAGGTIYNIDEAEKRDYRSNDIVVTSNLNETGDIRIRINGADRSNNIKNHILYLYGEP